MREKNTTLRVAILNQAAQSSTAVDSALVTGIMRAQFMLSTHVKKVAAIQSELQQCDEAVSYMRDALDTTQAPLAHHHSLGHRSELDGPARALSKEAVVVKAALGQMQQAVGSVEQNMHSLRSLTTRMSSEIDWLSRHAMRDNDCVTSVPCRGATAAPPPREKDTSVRRVRKQVQPHAMPLGGVLPAATTPSQQGGIESNAVAAAVPSVGWEEAYEASLHEACGTIEGSARARAEAVRSVKNAALRCLNQRAAVMDEFTRSVNGKMQQQRRNNDEVHLLEKRILSTEIEWKETSAAAIQLKVPLEVASNRQKTRTKEVGDSIEDALQKECVVLRRGRHELKKQCAKLSQSVKDMEKRRNFLLAENERLGAEGRTDRNWIAVDNPLNTGCNPSAPRVSGRRVFPGNQPSTVVLGTDTRSTFLPSQLRSTSSGALRPHSAPRSTESGSTISASPAATPGGHHHSVNRYTVQHRRSGSRQSSVGVNSAISSSLKSSAVFARPAAAGLPVAANGNKPTSQKIPAPPPRRRN